MQLTKHWATQLDDYAIDLAWSPDGQTLAAASAAGAITLFSSETGQRLHELAGHDDGTNVLAYAPNGTLLASGGQDGKVKFWDPVAGQHVATAALGQAWVEHLAWRPDAATPTLAAAAGRKFVFLGADGQVRHAFRDAQKTISAMEWTPGGGAVAVACFGGVTVWDADDFFAQKELPYGNGIQTLCWSPDGRWLVSGNQDPSMHLWLLREDQEFHMSGYEGKVKHLSFERSSHWLATSGGRDASVWDCSGAGPEGREPQMYPHDAAVCAVAFQHAGNLLATASQDGVLMLWSPDRAQPLRATVRMPTPATKIVWSPDDRRLAVGSEKGVVYILNCEE